MVAGSSTRRLSVTFAALVFGVSACTDQPTQPTGPNGPAFDRTTAPGQLKRAAPTFPADHLWVPLKKGGAPLVDISLDAAQPERDAVGDRPTGPDDPTMFVYSDTNYIYFRMRVDDEPQTLGTNWKPRGWGCQLSTDGNAVNGYEFMVLLDGKGSPDRIQLLVNLERLNTPSDQSAVYKNINATTTNTRATLIDIPNITNDEYFVEWAVLIDDLFYRRAIGPDYDVNLATQIQFVCGTNSDAQAGLTNGVSADLIGFGPGESPTWSAAASDLPFTLGCSTFPGQCEADEFCNPTSGLCESGELTRSTSRGASRATCAPADAPTG